VRSPPAILRTAMPDVLTESLALESARFLRDPPCGFSPVPLVDPGGVVTPGDFDAQAVSWTGCIVLRNQ
jgi:hypothetical protein